MASSSAECRLLILVGFLQIYAVCSSEGNLQPGTDDLTQWACGPQQPAELTSPGQLTSPQSLNGTYLLNCGCSWLVKAPPGQVVNLTFSRFDLEHVFTCAYANLTVFDDVEAKIKYYVDRFCGRSLPYVIYSSAQYLLIVYKTGHVGSGKGFIAWADFTDLTGWACGADRPAVLTWATGGLSSPGWPHPYRNITQCSWLIDVPQDIRLQFVDWHLAQATAGGCIEDWVAVYDGGPSRNVDNGTLAKRAYSANSESGEDSESATQPKLLGIYCGHVPPPPLGKTGRKMLIEFTGHSAIYPRRFRLMYNFRNTTDMACGIFRPAEIDWHPGIISSPRGDKAACKWRFAAPVGKVVRFKIVRFDLPTGCSQCGCAKLNVWDNKRDLGTPLGTYCGRGWTQEYFQTGSNAAFVKYDSYRMQPHTGFRIHFTFFDISEHACGIDRPINLTNKRGVLTTPSYGRGTYPNHLDCGWHLSAPFGQVIRFDFLDFDVQPCPNCACDALYITNGDAFNSPRIGRYCDDVRPHPVMTTGSEAYVRFLSDGVNTRRGVKINYRADPLSDYSCGTGQPADMSHEVGYIMSPNFDQRMTHYPQHANCSWLIKAPFKLKAIELHFLSLDIEYGARCEFDRLLVYDGGGSHAPLLVTVCGDTLQPNIKSTGDRLYLVFNSNHYIEGTGFYLSYKFIELPVSPHAVGMVPTIVFGILAFFVVFTVLVISRRVARRRTLLRAGNRQPAASPRGRETNAREHPTLELRTYRLVDRREGGIQPPMYREVDEQYQPLRNIAPPTYEESMSHLIAGEPPAQEERDPIPTTDTTPIDQGSGQYPVEFPERSPDEAGRHVGNNHMMPGDVVSGDNVTVAADRSNPAIVCRTSSDMHCAHVGKDDLTGSGAKYPAAVDNSHGATPSNVHAGSSKINRLEVAEDELHSGQPATNITPSSLNTNSCCFVGNVVSEPTTTSSQLLTDREIYTAPPVHAIGRMLAGDVHSPREVIPLTDNVAAQAASEIESTM